MGIDDLNVEMIKEKYPQLKMTKDRNSYICSGEFILNHCFKDVRMTGKFELEIGVPEEFPLALPKVKEVSHCID